MKKTVAFIVLILIVTASAFAHAGHMHTYMGTVTMLHGDNAFMIKTTAGKDLMIQTSPETTYLHADNHPAQKSELAPGTRVVVKMSKDGKIAATVKMSAPKK
jgi:hypothetical protein